MLGSTRVVETTEGPAARSASAGTSSGAAASVKLLTAPRGMDRDTVRALGPKLDVAAAIARGLAPDTGRPILSELVTLREKLRKSVTLKPGTDSARILPEGNVRDVIDDAIFGAASDLSSASLKSVSPDDFAMMKRFGSGTEETLKTLNTVDKKLDDAQIYPSGTRTRQELRADMREVSSHLDDGVQAINFAYLHFKGHDGEPTEVRPDQQATLLPAARLTAQALGHSYLLQNEIPKSRLHDSNYEKFDRSDVSVQTVLQTIDDARKIPEKDRFVFKQSLRPSAFHGESDSNYFRRDDAAAETFLNQAREELVGAFATLMRTPANMFSTDTRVNLTAAREKIAEALVVVGASLQANRSAIYHTEIENGRNPERTALTNGLPRFNDILAEQRAAKDAESSSSDSDGRSSGTRRSFSSDGDEGSMPLDLRLSQTPQSHFTQELSPREVQVYSDAMSQINDMRQPIRTRLQAAQYLTEHMLPDLDAQPPEDGWRTVHPSQTADRASIIDSLLTLLNSHAAGEHDDIAHVMSTRLVRHVANKEFTAHPHIERRALDTAWATMKKYTTYCEPRHQLLRAMISAAGHGRATRPQLENILASGLHHVATLNISDAHGAEYVLEFMQASKHSTVEPGTSNFKIVSKRMIDILSRGHLSATEANERHNSAVDGLLGELREASEKMVDSQLWYTHRSSQYVFNAMLAIARGQIPAGRVAEHISQPIGNYLATKRLGSDAKRRESDVFKVATGMVLRMYTEHPDMEELRQRFQDGKRINPARPDCLFKPNEKQFRERQWFYGMAGTQTFHPDLADPFNSIGMEPEKRMGAMVIRKLRSMQPY